MSEKIACPQNQAPRFKQPWRRAEAGVKSEHGAERVFWSLETIDLRQLIYSLRTRAPEIMVRRGATILKTSEISSRRYATESIKC